MLNFQKNGEVKDYNIHKKRLIIIGIFIFRILIGRIITNVNVHFKNYPFADTYRTNIVNICTILFLSFHHFNFKSLKFNEQSLKEVDESLKPVSIDKNQYITVDYFKKSPGVIYKYGDVFDDIPYCFKGLYSKFDIRAFDSKKTIDRWDSLYDLAFQVMDMIFEHIDQHEVTTKSLKSAGLDKPNLTKEKNVIKKYKKR